MGCPKAHAAATALLADFQRICSAWRPSHGHLVLLSPFHGLSWGCKAFCKPCCRENGEAEAEGPRAVSPNCLSERVQAGSHLCAAKMTSSQCACESTSRSELTHSVAVSGQTEQRNIAADVLTGARRPEGTGLTAVLHAFPCALCDDISIVHSIAHLDFLLFDPPQYCLLDQSQDIVLERTISRPCREEVLTSGIPETQLSLVSSLCSWIRSLIRRVFISNTNYTTGSQLHMPSDEAFHSKITIRLPPKD